MSHKILLIEDEEKTALSLKMGLEENKFTVDWVSDGTEGLRCALNNKYELIVSDIIIPEINGVELCAALRASGVSTPILLISALGTLDDKMRGFDAGSDDYLVKPFAFEELIARMKALMKRSKEFVKPLKVLTYGKYELDLEDKVIRVENVIVELTPREFALMEYFILNKEKVISRTEIAEKIWHITFDAATNVIDVYVNYLRKKLEKSFGDKLIQTRHGLGYMLKQS
jgi:two-component system, OmpR family, copper resistance phosphate regulon response regulator CusR